MGTVRYISLFIIITILSWISIYRSHLQYNIGSFNVLRQQKEIKNAERIEEASTKTEDYKDKVQRSFLQNSSQCHNCTIITKSQKEWRTWKTSGLFEKKRKIWISMGLCFTKNTEMYGKRKYPYAQVTPLAIILWYHFFPTINVIIYLVYDKNENDDRRKLYEDQLRQTKVEIRWIKSDDMSCVSKSQLIRMWAFQEPMIKNDDIIITVDVNLFAATSKILDPIFENPNLKLWNFQWHRAAFVNTSIGETFNQNLISATSKGKKYSCIRKSNS